MAAASLKNLGDLYTRELDLDESLVCYSEAMTGLQQERDMELSLSLQEGPGEGEREGEGSSLCSARIEELRHIIDACERRTRDRDERYARTGPTE